MPNCTPLFITNDFYEGLLSGRSPLPSWEESRLHIHILFFSQLRHHLQNRVRAHIPNIVIEPLQLTDSNGTTLKRFERRHLPLVNQHFIGVCIDLKQHINLMKHVGINYDLDFVNREVDRLLSLLRIIGCIIHYATQPTDLKNNSKPKQLSTGKILLELKKDRAVSRSTSASTISDRSTPTESLESYSFFYDDQMESKKETEMASSDDEDLDAYFKEIRSMASSITDDESPIRDEKWKPLSNYGMRTSKIIDLEKFNAVCESAQTFDDDDQNEFSWTSTTIETNELLISYQKIEKRRMEEKRQMEIEMIADNLISEMNSNIAGCLDLFLGEASY